MLRRYDRVLAATATTVAWVAAACGPQRCPVHLSDLASGSDTQVAGPRGMSANTGAFRPDGRYLAVVFGGGDTTGPATPATPVRVGVIDASTGRLLAVSGAVMVGGGGDFWLAVTCRRMALGCCCRPQPASTPSSPLGGPATLSFTFPGGYPRPASTWHRQASSGKPQ
jgi:hypothetical protein